MAERQPGDIDAYAGHLWRRWDTWLDGTVWRFELGVDFSHQKTLRSECYRRAAQRGLRVRTHWDGERYLYIQAVKSDGGPLEPPP
jgi:hypothetical protein